MVATHPIWYWREGAIEVYLLRDDGDQRSDRSACFPQLDVPLLASFLNHPTSLQAVRAFRDALK